MRPDLKAVLDRLGELEQSVERTRHESPELLMQLVVMEQRGCRVRQELRDQLVVMERSGQLGPLDRSTALSKLAILEVQAMLHRVAASVVFR